MRKPVSKEKIKVPLKRKSPGRPTKKPKDVLLNKHQLIELYKQMLLIRRFEEKAGQLYGMGSIGGFCHLYIGQEAVVVGMQSVCEPGDSVITSYRDHGHMLSCGMDPKGVMAELTGRDGGYSKGKGGSMHMFSREKNFYGGHGIVGAQVPIGVGLAFSHRYKEDGFVCMTYLGDGAVNQGQVYESFNMSALWKLPVVFIIENNKYGMGTSVTRASAGRSLAERGKAYGIPGMEVDGMNVLSVRQAGKEALDYARKGKGPYILEMKTYRYRGHSMSDAQHYRTKDEVEEYRKIDPISQVKKILLDKKYATKADIEKIDSRVKEKVIECVKFAEDSPFPDKNLLYDAVYEQKDYPFLKHKL